jgi:glutamate 5-kinase
MSIKVINFDENDILSALVSLIIDIDKFIIFTKLDAF